MTLSCSCDFDVYDAPWYWRDVNGFHPIKSIRRKRCCSCKSHLIDHDEDALEFYRYRVPRSDVEERIYGEEVKLGSDYMCEECSGLFMALEELGYECLDIRNPMKDYVAEYNDLREAFPDGESDG